MSAAAENPFAFGVVVPADHVFGPTQMRDAHPQPNIWPACSHCGHAYVLRLGLTQHGPTWLWQRDCKHKTSPAIRTTIEGI